MRDDLSHKERLEYARMAIEKSLEIIAYFEENPNSDKFSHFDAHHLLTTVARISQMVEKLPYIDFDFLRRDTKSG